MIWAWPNCTSRAFAGRFIGAEHRRVGLLELQRQALAHDAGCVDGIDERFNVGVDQISS
jgi:hypothetical protein